MKDDFYDKVTSLANTTVVYYPHSQVKEMLNLDEKFVEMKMEFFSHPNSPQNP